MKTAFTHYDLRLIEPLFGSNLTDLIIELDYLRKKRLQGTTDPIIFFQLKAIYHLLESFGSARIEGNRTTLAEFIETKIDNNNSRDEQFIEIENMEKAHAFIDDNINNYTIDKIFVSEIHKQVVEQLTSEGSKTPGNYRKKDILINNSVHRPPNTSLIAGYMDELFAFINKNDSAKYDLLKTAITHHRFAWIHPFDNGNGRTGRLLTYAMLVKQGFNVHAGRIINPTAIFCIDRGKYYDFLSEADSGKEKAILAWCEYVLTGLKNELDKIDKLLDHDYLSNQILLPMLKLSEVKKYISPSEGRILSVAVKKQRIRASDIKKIFPTKIPAEISRMIRGLRNKKMLIPAKENSRIYSICFRNNHLLRCIIEILDKNNFLPIK